MLTRLIVDLYGWIIDRTVCRRVEMKEIESNDYNLNISRYVSTTQYEVEIDLKAIHTKLVSIDGEIRTATAKHRLIRDLRQAPHIHAMKNSAAY